MHIQALKETRDFLLILTWTQGLGWEKPCKQSTRQFNGMILYPIFQKQMKNACVQEFTCGGSEGQLEDWESFASYSPKHIHTFNGR